MFISGFLIFINWAVWIYAVATNRIIDASFGYFIMPIISVLLGYIFFKENLNKKKILSIFLVLFSIFYLIFFNLKSLPWVGLIVAFSWAFYNLVRKKIEIDTDIGLLIARVGLLYYFGFFFIITPFVGWIEKPNKLPLSISDVYAKNIAPNIGGGEKEICISFQ